MAKKIKKTNQDKIAAKKAAVLGTHKKNRLPVAIAAVGVFIISAARILKPWWRLKGSIPVADEIVLGAEAARILNLDGGNQLMIGNNTLRVIAIQQVVKGRMETLNQLKKFSYGVSFVILLIGSLVVLVTMMGSVRERTDEIGIFRAIGFRKVHIMRIVFMEAAIVSGLAGLLEYGLGRSGRHGEQPICDGAR